MKKIEKTLENVCGIYKIINLINGKFYIGSSKNLRNRLWKHRSLLRHNKHHNPHLQNSWDKYGEDNFDYCILEVCDEKCQYEREQYYIDSCHPEYNIAEIVELPSYSEESRKKHSNTRKRMFSEGILKPSGCTTIYAYDLNGNFIKAFLSIAQASRELNINRHQISKNLSGQQKRCHIYMFSYDKIQNMPAYRKTKNVEKQYKKIRVYNENEEYLFKNGEECAQFFNVHLVYIRDAIKHHRKFKRKYTIEYVTAR